ncbi:MAG: DUF2314 domain-containing protein [Pseudomonadota bacterium]
MREPDLFIDGWRLHSGEQYHAAAPDTFLIPPRMARQNLWPGYLAKLIFEIHVDNDEDPCRVERMWVIVRELTKEGYLGILDNNPYCIEENDELWSGIELPFGPHHIIAIEVPDERSVKIADSTPIRRWPPEIA